MIWCALYTHVRCEEKAAEALRAKGLVVHLPRLKKAVRHARRLIEVERPLFPRYLFVRMADHEIHEVRITDGVYCIISNQGKPVSIPSAFLNELAFAEYHGEFDSTNDSNSSKTPNPFEVGQHVLVTEGAFIGREAVVTEANPGQRVGVEIELFGKIVPLEVNVASVQVAYEKAA